MTIPKLFKLSPGGVNDRVLVEALKAHLEGRSHITFGGRQIAVEETRHSRVFRIPTAIEAQLTVNAPRKDAAGRDSSLVRLVIRELAAQDGEETSCPSFVGSVKVCRDGRIRPHFYDPQADSYHQGLLDAVVSATSTGQVSVEQILTSDQALGIIRARLLRDLPGELTNAIAALAEGAKQTQATVPTDNAEVGSGEEWDEYEPSKDSIKNSFSNL